MTAFDRIREDYLEKSSDRGEGVIEESRTAQEFASLTGSIGLDAREDIEHEYAPGSVEAEAARFVGYEVTENARRAAFSAKDMEEIEFEKGIIAGESTMEEIMRAFTLLDRLAGGYSDLVEVKENIYGRNIVKGTEVKRFPSVENGSFNPDSKYVNWGVDETGSVDPDNLSTLFWADKILVINDEWITYRRGGKPETLDRGREYMEQDESVLEFLWDRKVGGVSDPTKDK